MPETRRTSVVPPALVDGLQGNLAQTNILDLLQFLYASTKTGELILRRHLGGAEGRAYFVKGTLVHAVAGGLVGMEALVELTGWEDGTFSFSHDVLSPNTTITLPPQQALMEAVRIHDERQEQLQRKAQAEQEGSSDIMDDAKASADVLEDFLKIPGISSAVVIGRDGFLIESAGASSAVSVEDLGASLAHAVNGIEEMGSELQVSTFQDLFVEYGRAVIICRPAGDAIVAVVAPDASKLGIIRHKIRPLVEEIGHYF